jgi:hypothetical protein
MIRNSCPAALAASALIMALTTGFATAESPVDLKNHKPLFRWEISPSSQQSIYDGEALVADFYGGANEMRGIGRPISLHNLRLIPGGPLAIEKGEACGPLCLSWRKHVIFYADSKYRVNAMVRTKGVTGSAQLVWQAGKADRQASPPLSGNTDWTPVTLEIASVTGPATLKLVQEGAGQTWFDNVEMIKESP